jgi:hypothetical protein
LKLDRATLRSVLSKMAREVCPLRDVLEVVYCDGGNVARSGKATWPSRLRIGGVHVAALSEVLFSEDFDEVFAGDNVKATTPLDRGR